MSAAKFGMIGVIAVVLVGAIGFSVMKKMNPDAKI